MGPKAARERKDLVSRSRRVERGRIIVVRDEVANLEGIPSNLLPVFDIVDVNVMSCQDQNNLRPWFESARPAAGTPTYSPADCTTVSPEPEYRKTSLPLR